MQRFSRLVLLWHFVSDGAPIGDSVRSGGQSSQDRGEVFRKHFRIIRKRGSTHTHAH
jgi:hypothetical protein